MYNCWCTRGFHGLRCDHKYVLSNTQNQNNNNINYDGADNDNNRLGSVRLYNESSVSIDTINEHDNGNDQENYKQLGISLINPDKVKSSKVLNGILGSSERTRISQQQHPSRALMLNNFFVIFSSILILFLLIR